jgi:protein-S-isoprenylcysteine O-methyltransferase Ste14
MIQRIAAFTYGVASYMVALVSFLYLAAFLGDFGISHSIDSAPTGPIAVALAVDLGLLLLFGLQHSVMARPGFKAVWTKIVPPVVERSTYVLFSSLALFVLFWKWQAIGGVIWDVQNDTARIAMYALYALGWAIVLAVTFLINHFDLFGLRQVWLYLIGRPYTPVRFRMPGPYRLVRHPLYVGWLMVFWSTPKMTAAHLVCTVAITAYILIAIRYEERDLVTMHPEYAEYRKRVPMLVPVGSSSQGKRGSLPAGAATEMEG